MSAVWIFHAAAVAWLLGSACHDTGQADNGAGCEADGECQSGFCWAGCRDPAADDDGDGLDNRDERRFGLSPVHADTDGDGLLDSFEVGLSGEGLARDTDGDGLIDALESRIADQDGDCLPDELDASDERASEDELARLLCRSGGVCEGVVARCDGLQAVCDYTQSAGYEPVEASCDGRDNDCDGQTDEGLVYLESTGALKLLGERCVGRGECGTAIGEVECGADGQVVCSVDREGSAPAGALEDRDCDGRDNDCDGQTDEGVAWVEPDTGLVKRFGAACRARGVCGLSAGRVECSANGRGICSTEPGGSADLSGPERCDGLDEDCDGRTDEGLSFRDPAGGPALFVGEPCGRGACSGSTVACAGGVAVCPGLSAKADEVCNGADDDCDGQTDEAADVAKGCSTLGECAGREVLASCEAEALVCRYRVDGGVRGAAASDAVCDGLDEDCDGQTDEDLAVVGGGRKGDPCLGSGLCATVEGFLVCAGGGLVCSADAGLAEVCDGVDNDCDGVTDDEPSGAPSCRVAGVCAAAAGGAVCEAGDWSCPHEALAAFRELETADLDCDGLDNDCDGCVDEGSRLWPADSYEEVWAAPPPLLLAASANGLGELWVHGGLGGGQGGDAGRELWRFSGAWERVAVSNDGPARAGHAAAFEPAAGVLVIQGGFERAEAEAVGLGPDGTSAYSMWAFDPGESRWVEVTQHAEEDDLQTEIARDAELRRILGRRHHALTALGDGRLVLHGGLGEVGAPEALLGTLRRDGDGFTCDWVPLSGPGWRAGHRAAAIEIGGAPWVVLAGGSSGAGWDVFSLDSGASTATIPGGPVGELRVGLVAIPSGLVALGARTHVLEPRQDGTRVVFAAREVPGGLPAPVVAGRVGGEALGLSLGSGEVLSIGPTGSTNARDDLMWPAPRRRAALWFEVGAGAGGLGGVGVMGRAASGSQAGGLWLVGGERESDGAALEDLWLYPLSESSAGSGSEASRAAWVRVAAGTGWGGDARFAAASGSGSGSGGVGGALWAARPGPTGVTLARLTTGAQVRWQGVEASGLGPAAVGALGVLDDEPSTAVLVLSPGGSGLLAHMAQVDDAGGANPSATWTLVGEWVSATAVLALGRIGDGLGVAAKVGSGVQVRRLDRSGFGPVVTLSALPVGPIGDIGVHGELGAWADGPDRGFLVGAGGVWVLDAEVRQLVWHPVAGSRPGATALGEDAALWAFGSGLGRIPLVCE